jgi:hypothetical protein
MAGPTDRACLESMGQSMGGSKSDFTRVYSNHTQCRHTSTNQIAIGCPLPEPGIARAERTGAPAGRTGGPCEAITGGNAKLVSAKCAIIQREYAACEEKSAAGRTVDTVVFSSSRGELV